MLNAIRCMDQRLAFKNCGISCLTLIFILRKPRTTILHAKMRFQVARYNEWYTVFSTDRYEVMTQWLRQFPVSRAIWFRSSHSPQTPCASRPLCMALSPSVHWHALFYSAAHSIFYFLGFRQWRSRTDRVVNLNANIRIPLFWRTWTQAWASTRPNVLAWHMSRDNSDCSSSELTDSQVSGFGFSWFLENTVKP